MYSAFARELTPVIIKVTFETVSAVALKFSITIFKLTELVGHNSYVTEEIPELSVPSTKTTSETPISCAETVALINIKNRIPILESKKRTNFFKRFM